MKPRKNVLSIILTIVFLYIFASIILSLFALLAEIHI